MVASACGSGASANTDDDSACLVGSTDCADDPTADFPVEEARQRATEMLGAPASELPDDVRIGRIGDESLDLTEDYQLGRLTVALDHDGTPVVEVTAELPDGPETLRLDQS